jgi:hypothetical protein
VQPVFPTNLSEPFDLAHVFSGGSVVFTSDQHFGVGSNLILPGRGEIQFFHFLKQLVMVNQAKIWEMAGKLKEADNKDTKTGRSLSCSYVDMLSIGH